jgi:hypothetical protein
LTSLSPEAILAIFSPDADSDLFMLVTIYDPNPVTVSAGSFIIGKTYSILSVGTTDFTNTSIGAVSNAVGTIFRATGVGTGTGTASDIVAMRLCDGYTKRISETADEVIYGVTSRGNDFTFLPIQITLPQEDEAQAPKCTITLNDVTRHVTPLIRSLTASPKVLLELVLSKNPTTLNRVEVSFSGLYITNFTYNADSVVATLAMTDYEREPFPMHTFSPKYFPGLF